MDLKWQSSSRPQNKPNFKIFLQKCKKRNEKSIYKPLLYVVWSVDIFDHNFFQNGGASVG